jgi:hypothetical protein
MMLINSFEGSCGTFGEGKKIHCCLQHWFNLPNFLIKKSLELLLLFFKKMITGKMLA